MPTERDCVRHLVNVRSDGLLALQETLALGLMVVRKWDRATVSGIEPNAEDAIRHDNFTLDELHEFRSYASRLLLEYAAALPSPACSVPRPSWWRGVAQSLTAAFLYSFVLVVIGFAVKLFGSDLLTVLRFLIGSN